MNSRWIFQKLNPTFPSSSWAVPLISRFSTRPSAPPFSSETPKYSLNCVGISRLLSICGREGNLLIGSSLHASIIKNPGLENFGDLYNLRNFLVVCNSLLSMYSKCGDLSSAVEVFDHMKTRDTISWNSIISGFLTNGEFKIGFGYFKEMIGMGFDHASLTTILTACDGLDYIGVNKMVHGLVILSGYEKEISVGNALITSYCRCGSFESGRRVFDEMVERNVITWTAVISGLLQNELYEESLKLFVKMCRGLVTPNYLTYLSALSACAGLQALKEGCQIHGSVWKLGIQADLCVESALMDMYSKCGSLEDAWQIFESAEVIDEVSLTVLLVGSAQNGHEDQAIQIFTKMMKTGLKIDANTISAVLGVFGTDTSLGLGRQVHCLVIKKGFDANTYVSNGLINMYSKCGELQEPAKVFVKMPHRNQVSWNSMIAASARHGDGFRALELYEEMKSEGLEPTDVTFLSLLQACSHVGLVKRGMEFFRSMQNAYGIMPRMEHYACVVDMLGRAGLVKEAKNFIEGLEVKPDALVWQALLGACGIHGDTKMGKYAADQLAVASPDSPVPYIQMANIYSSRGKWKDRARTIRKMKEIGVGKDTGISWIEIDGKIHSFVVADQMHPKGDFIYQALFELVWHMKDEGYLPDNRFVFQCKDQDEKESSLDSLTSANSFITDVVIKIELSTNQ